MKQIVEFTREINFDTNVDEVVSISLDKRVNNVKDGIISGEFDLYLEYKESDISIDTNKYDKTIPFDIDLDSRYILDNVNVDIDDFYYEIGDKSIMLHIDLLIDNLELDDRVVEEEVPMHKEEPRDLSPDKEEKKEVKVEPKYETFDSKMNSFVTYNVHIVRDDDNIDSICQKYNITKEDLSSYNDITNIKLGDKLIVPTYEK